MMYSKKIIDLRNEQNLKQYELANIIEVKPKTYSAYEEEYDTISITNLNKISNFFKVSIDYIFELTKSRDYLNLKKDINISLSSERIKALRKENNLTQAKLASFLNVDISLISKIETQKQLIATQFLYAICKKYNISADYLLGKTDSPKYLK